MLTALRVENFKGFAAAQRIEFSPLTLLFGPNNAGKSTVIQALLFLHELLERGKPDVDRTELGGAVLELGGLGRLVHRHDLNRSIVVRADFTTLGELNWMSRALDGALLPELEDALGSAWVEVSATHRLTVRRLEGVIDRVVVGSGDHPLVTIEASPKLREAEPILMRVHLGHPLLAAQASRLMTEWEDVAVQERVSAEAKAQELSLLFAVSSSRPSAMPDLSEPVLLAAGAAGDGRSQAGAEVQAFLELTVVGVLRQLAAELRGALYVGPLRSIPPRGFLYERSGRLVSWADGLAAWDVLLSDRADLVERVNKWLTHVGAGCEIVTQSLFDTRASAEAISEEHVDSTVRRLLLSVAGGIPVLPSEVGAGISQVIPVVVAALFGRPSMLMVEQPELHIHPSMQTGLGDLLIDAATRENSRRAVLVETHSEHLVLRLLRRIRETSGRALPEDAPALSPDKLSVLWVERDVDGTTVRRLRVDEAGEFIDAWPQGFFDERFAEVYGP